MSIIAATTNGELVSPEGTQEGEYLGSSSHQTAATPHCEPQGSSGCEKHRTLAWDSQNANERDDFSESRLLHLTIHTKALNSLTWDIWFSLIHKILLNFRLPTLWCKPLYNQIPPPTSLEQFSQSYLRCYLLGLKFPQNKT